MIVMSKFQVGTDDRCTAEMWSGQRRQLSKWKNNSVGPYQAPGGRECREASFADAGEVPCCAMCLAFAGVGAEVKVKIPSRRYLLEMFHRMENHHVKSFEVFGWASMNGPS